MWLEVRVGSRSILFGANVLFSAACRPNAGLTRFWNLSGVSTRTLRRHRRAARRNLSARKRSPEPVRRRRRTRHASSPAISATSAFLRQNLPRRPGPFARRGPLACPPGRSPPSQSAERASSASTPKARICDAQPAASPYPTAAYAKSIYAS